MRMLIASDLHGSLDSLRFLIAKARNLEPDLIVLLGDLVYHGPRNPLPASYDTVSILETMPTLQDLPSPVCAVRGNCDGEVDVNLMPFAMPQSAWLEADGLRIFASHGHHLPDMPPFAGIKKGDVVLRGHTHIPRGETREGIHIWNPGSMSLPKGGSPRSYGIYENGIFRVLDWNDQEVLSHKPEIGQ